VLAASGVFTVSAQARQLPIHRSWYGRAAVPPGDGPAAPFNSLAAVEHASGPGDTIIVVPSPLSVAPLDGGIALKAGQHLIGGGPPVLGGSGLRSLPRVTNTTKVHVAGDAVELADNTEVANIVVAGPYRGGIYGMNVTGVDVHGNDISGQNTSCTDGLFIPPFTLGSYAPFVGADFAIGVQNGWAAIMVDRTHGMGSVAIDNNYVHDGFCGDGIDIRSMGTASIDARVQANLLTRLRQGSRNGIISILAIGLQAIGAGKLRVDNAGNMETYIGNPGQTDADAQFVSIADSGSVTDIISHNTFRHGIGDFSSNGMEFVISNGTGSGYMHILDSSFEDDPGDMLEEFNFGSGSRMELVLDNVETRHTTLNGGTAAYADPPGHALGPGNIGDCLTVFDVGANDMDTLVMRNSHFSDCDNNGLEINNNVVPTNAGSGVGLIGIPKGISAGAINVEIDHSSITASRYYALWVNNMTPVKTLTVRVQNSNLSTSGGEAVAFDQQTTASTQDTQIDLGGGSLGSVGQNCIFDGALADMEATRYHVMAKHNWWGTPGGPAPGTTTVNPSERTGVASITANPALTEPPPACQSEAQ
jgi:hypothetical protein